MKIKEAAAGRLIPPCKACLILCILILFSLFPAAAATGNYTSLNVWTAGSENIVFSDVSVINFNSLEHDKAAISEITFSGIRPGTYNLIFTQSNGNAHTGQMVYDTSGLLGTSGNWSLSLDGYSYSWTGINVEPLGKMYIATYAQDIDTGEKGIILLDGWVGNTIVGTVTGNYNCVFSPVPSITAYPITDVQVIGSDTFTATISYGDYETVMEEISNDDLTIWEWIGTLFDFVGNTSGFLFAMIATFKFIFVDHFFSILLFYECILAAYSMSHSRDIFTFGRKFFRSNVAFFTGIFGFIQFIVNFFHKLIDTLKP
jgi:hypothetical protein